MKVIRILLLVVFWIVCGYYNWGHTLGYFSHRFPWDNHNGIATITAIGGPLAVPAVWNGGDGFKYWRTVPMTIEERWGAFHKQWPDLPREEFDREN